MQVEYESLPEAEASSTHPEEAQHEIEHEQEHEDEEEEDEAGQAELEEEGSKKKQKRIFKSRQSLAEKQVGTTIFPVSRVKKIAKADRDIDLMTPEATFMLSVAAEYFIKHFMEEGYTKARLEKRKIVNYKDMAAVVSRSEEFDFLRGRSSPVIHQNRRGKGQGMMQNKRIKISSRMTGTRPSIWAGKRLRGIAIFSLTFTLSPLMLFWLYLSLR
ncbi:DNA polymerase epsilon subunit 4, partial [Tremellales sp. Uapishka_1]